MKAYWLGLFMLLSSMAYGQAPPRTGPLQIQNNFNEILKNGAAAQQQARENLGLGGVPGSPFVERALNGIDFASPPTTLLNLGGMGRLNASGFYDIAGVFHSITCDGVTDNSAVLQFALPTLRTIYIGHSSGTCIFSDLILTNGQSLIGDTTAVQVAAGGRYLASLQGQGVIDGFSVFGGGETVLTTVAATANAGDTSVVINAEATASAATVNGATLTLGGTIAGTFLKNMMFSDGANTKLSATASGYFVGTTYHVVSHSQGQVAIGQLVQVTYGVPLTRITAQLTTAVGDESTWTVSVSQGNLGSSIDLRSVFSAMTIATTPCNTAGCLATLSGNAGTISASAISGTRIEVGERMAVQMDPDGYRHSAMVLGMVQNASLVTATLAQPLPEGTVAGRTIYSTWGSFNMGCNAATGGIRNIVWNVGAYSGLLVGCPTAQGTGTQGDITNLEVRQGLRNFFLVVAGRAGPLQINSPRLNTSWSYTGSVNGDGGPGPYPVKEPVNFGVSASFLSSVVSGSQTYTYVPVDSVIGPTNFTILPTTYQMLFGSNIPLNQPINYTEGNLFAAEGIIMDGDYGTLSGMVNAFHITAAQGGACQNCYSFINDTYITTGAMAGSMNGTFGDPAMETMVKVKGRVQLDLDTGRISRGTRAVVDISGVGANVVGNIHMNPTADTLNNVMGVTSQDLVLDPVASYFGRIRTNSGLSTYEYAATFVKYIGAIPQVSTSGTCTVASDVVKGSYYIPCVPDVTFTGSINNNALTTSGNPALVVGMQINGAHNGVPQNNIKIASGSGNSWTLQGCAACGVIASGTLYATTLLPGQVVSDTTYMSAQTTVIVFDYQKLYLTNRTTAAITAGTVIPFAGPTQPIGSGGPIGRKGLFADKGAAASYTSTTYLATDLPLGNPTPGGCLLMSNGSRWKPASGKCVVLHVNAETAKTSAVGSGAQENLIFASMPANLPGPNGYLDFSFNAVSNGTAGLKHISILLGGNGTDPIFTPGCQFVLFVTTGTNQNIYGSKRLWWQQISNSQKSGGQGLVSGGVGSTMLSCSVTTNAVWGISANAFVDNIADDIAYEDFTVEWGE